MTIEPKLLPNTHYSAGWTRTPWIIVLHFTAGYTEKQCWDVLKNRGLSVHLCINRDGSTFRYVSDQNRAWHAGFGVWGGQSWLNNHALGTEVVNFGWGEGPFKDEDPSPHTVYKWNDVNDPELIIGENEFYRDEGYVINDKKIWTRVVTRQPMEKFPDHRIEWKNKMWATYPDEQLRAVARTTFRWMKKYNILPENVVGHEHVTPHKKTDPGPGFPWLRFEKILNKKMNNKAPHLLDATFNRGMRIKAVQSHCARMGLQVGDIDGIWGSKTETAVKEIIDRFGKVYSFENLIVDPNNCYKLCNAFRLVPGEPNS